jgi:hypothetical protein
MNRCIVMYEIIRSIISRILIVLQSNQNVMNYYESLPWQSKKLPLYYHEKGISSKGGNEKRMPCNNYQLLVFLILGFIGNSKAKSELENVKNRIQEIKMALIQERNK